MLSKMSVLPLQWFGFLHLYHHLAFTDSSNLSCLMNAPFIIPSASKCPLFFYVATLTYLTVDSSSVISLTVQLTDLHFTDMRT